MVIAWDLILEIGSPLKLMQIELFYTFAVNVVSQSSPAGVVSFIDRVKGFGEIIELRDFIPHLCTKVKIVPFFKESAAYCVTFSST